MSQCHKQERNHLLLLSRCLQKPGHWLTERITNGTLYETLSMLSCKATSAPNAAPAFNDTMTPCLDVFLHQTASYRSMPEQQIQAELSEQYKLWTQADMQKQYGMPAISPFREEHDPLHSYRHLPGQEIIEWYHCCGMKMPQRFMGRPDSISMELEFAVYLKGLLCRQPKNSDFLQIYQIFLQRFLLPDLARILDLDTHAQNFPFYYQLTAVIREYLCCHQEVSPSLTK